MKTWQEWRLDYEWCWACGDYVGWAERCHECEAPAWGGYIYSGVSPTRGVYIIRSEVGLTKIGVSGNMAERFVMLRKAAGRSAGLTALACMPGAGYAVERWLHRRLAETRDPKWAKAEGLPNHTEWFWPSPALNGLVRGNTPTARALEPELARFDAPLRPWEASDAA